jgi:hypothetical protein
MAESPPPQPPRRPLEQRLLPWADLLYKLIAAAAAALAIWKALE